MTLAEEQARYAQEKIERLGLGHLAKVECRDYATVDGVYDKVSAICILEHIGEGRISRRSTERCIVH